MLESKHWTMDPDRLISSISILNGRIMADKKLTVYVPYRYFSRKLATMSSVVQCLALFVVVDDMGNWATCALPNMINLNPINSTIVVIDDEEYLALRYEKGQAISDNSSLLMDSKVVYNMYDAGYGAGWKPWFLSYIDYSKIMYLATSHAGIRISVNNVPSELTVAQIAKNPQDKTQSYRQVVKGGYKFGKSLEPTITPLQNILFGANNTTTRLVGAYLNQGILSSLDQESTRIEPIEQLLRL